MSIRIEPVFSPQWEKVRARCRRLYNDHNRRAKADGMVLDYEAADLEEMAEYVKQCFYCSMPLDLSFQADHATPTSRDVTGHKLSNIVLSCSRCNQMKGQLSGSEFMRLLDLLDGFHPSGLEDVRRRLIHGGKVYAKSRKNKTR